MQNFKLLNKGILGFGEIMMRLTPPSYQKIIQCSSFDATYSGGEANVIASLSIFGHKTKFFTKLPNNNLGNKVVSNFKGYNVDMSEVLLGDGRLGIYFAEIGHGIRGTEVIYDRKYSSISLLEKSEVNLDSVLKDVGLVHLSGITPALSENLKEITLDIAKYCNKNNIVVSYDSNYRSKLWSIDEASEFLQEILNYVDIGFLGHLDITNILKFDNESSEFESNLKILYQKVCQKYPNLKYLASTKRTVNSINNNSLTGYIFNENKLFKSKEYSFDIVDRIGGGDAFTAGILHGIIESMPNEKIIEFATCASSLKHSIVGDINFSDKDSIESLIVDGICNVKR